MSNGSAMGSALGLGSTAAAEGDAVTDGIAVGDGEGDGLAMPGSLAHQPKAKAATTNTVAAPASWTARLSTFAPSRAAHPRRRPILLDAPRSITCSGVTVSGSRATSTLRASRRSTSMRGSKV